MFRLGSTNQQIQMGPAKMILGHIVHNHPMLKPHQTDEGCPLMIQPTKSRHFTNVVRQVTTHVRTKGARSLPYHQIMPERPEGYQPILPFRQLLSVFRIPTNDELSIHFGMMFHHTTEHPAAIVTCACTSLGEQPKILLRAAKTEQ